MALRSEPGLGAKRAGSRGSLARTAARRLTIGGTLRQSKARPDAPAPRRWRGSTPRPGDASRRAPPSRNASTQGV